jgi:hypothetical protein
VCSLGSSKASQVPTGSPAFRIPTELSAAKRERETGAGLSRTGTERRETSPSDRGGSLKGPNRWCVFPSARATSSRAVLEGVMGKWGGLWCIRTMDCAKKVWEADLARSKHERAALLG